MVESAIPTTDLYELAGILRTLCLASSTITHIIKVHVFLSNDPNNFYREVDEAIRQVGIEMGILPPPDPYGDDNEPSSPPFKD